MLHNLEHDTSTSATLSINHATQTDQLTASQLNDSDASQPNSIENENMVRTFTAGSSIDEYFSDEFSNMNQH